MYTNLRFAGYLFLWFKDGHEICQINLSQVTNVNDVTVFIVIPDNIIFSSETAEGIELDILRDRSRHPSASMTPPIQCSSRTSVVEGAPGRRGTGITPADSMEYINKMIKEELYYTRGSGKIQIHWPGNDQHATVIPVLVATLNRRHPL